MARMLGPPPRVRPRGAVPEHKFVPDLNGAWVYCSTFLFQPWADPMQRLFYSASVLHCLPVSRAEQPSAATGTLPETHTRQW